MEVDMEDIEGQWPASGRTEGREQRELNTAKLWTLVAGQKLGPLTEQGKAGLSLLLKG
jgi:hypothetical protein